MNKNDQWRHRERQRGAAAIEFAFVFPLLLALVYCLIVYGYLFVVRQSIEFAAHKGIEAAIAVDPGATDAQTQRQTQAKQAANCALQWLSGTCTAAVANNARVVPQYTLCAGTGTTACPAGYGLVTVTYKVNNGGSWIFPKLIGLPMVGTIPPMPETMMATAIAKLEP